MPKDPTRSLRVAELIQRELALMLQREWQQPRHGMITVSTVQMSPDLQHAKIFVTMLAPQDDVHQTIKALNTDRVSLRMKLAKRIILRYTPELRFYYDDTLDKADHLQRLLGKVNDDEEQ